MLFIMYEKIRRNFLAHPTLERIIKNIDSLPPLSDVANLVHELYNSDDEDILKLVKIIESDALLTANILKMINSPLYSFSRQINSITKAVVFLGTQTIYNLILNYAMKQHLKADPQIYGFDSAQFNDMCQLQSCLVMKWYGKLNIRDARFLSSLALMMESGKLVLAMEVEKSDYADIFRKSFIECANIQEFEKDLINSTSYQISGFLFKHWNLDPLYIDILNELDYKESSDVSLLKHVAIIEIVRTTINLREILTDQSIASAALIVKEVGLDEEQFKTIAFEIRDNYLNS